MLQRIVEIAEEGRRVALSRGFLTVRDESKELGRIPLDDVAVLMISAASGYLSKPLLTDLAQRGAVTILCDKQYKPVFMGLPEAASSEAVSRIQAQASTTLPLKKNLWRSIVREKLSNQADVLDYFENPSAAKELRALADRVQSGDKGNKEAWGARIYWKALMGSDFKRDREEPGINAYLNYGYTVIRSACARAVSATGLLPMFGLMHGNNRDYFALADDLMEPFRPVVDVIVKSMSAVGNQKMTAEMKHHLSKVLWFDVEGKRGTGPLINAIQDTALSLAESFLKKKDKLFFPKLFAIQKHIKSLCI